jgi:hypothetical protein
VVIHYLDVYWTCLGPYKTDSPLVVDANAVLSLSVASQGFQVVAGRRLHEIQCLSRIQLRQLPLCYGQECLESTRALALVQRLGVFALERLDHADSVLRET